MKQIILNADDFGRHAQINHAVERGVRDGVLRSATIMPGGAAFDDAAALAARTPALGVGIHLTLVNGNPVLPPAEIPSLVTEAGVVLDLCCAAGIPAIRAPRARLFAGKFGGIGQLIGRTGLAVLARRAAAKARQRGIRTPEHFAGIVAGEAVDTSALSAVAANLREGTTEVMLHPGTDNAVLVRDCLWDHDFEAELAAVCAPEVAAALAVNGAQIANFRAYSPRERGLHE